MGENGRNWIEKKSKCSKLSQNVQKCPTQTHCCPDGPVFSILDSGGFLFVNRQGAAGGTRDVARIKSTLISPTPAGGRCLSFWYYAHGPHVNALRVYATMMSPPTNLVWQRKGTGEWWASNEHIDDLFWVKNKKDRGRYLMSFPILRIFDFFASCCSGVSINMKRSAFDFCSSYFADLLEWRQAHVNIEMQRSFVLLFEAVRGKTFDGIMAIDDIKFSG